MNEIKELIAELYESTLTIIDDMNLINGLVEEIDTDAINTDQNDESISDMHFYIESTERHIEEITELQQRLYELAVERKYVLTGDTATLALTADIAIRIKINDDAESLQYQYVYGNYFPREVKPVKVTEIFQEFNESTGKTEPAFKINDEKESYFISEFIKDEF